MMARPAHADVRTRVERGPLIHTFTALCHSLPLVTTQAIMRSAPVRALLRPASHQAATSRAAPAVRATRTPAQHRGVCLRAALLETVTERGRGESASLGASPSSLESWPTAPPPADELASTSGQRAVVACWWAALAAAGVQVGAETVSSGGATEIVAATAAAYVFADLGSGLFHWLTDNYGDRSTVRGCGGAGRGGPFLASRSPHTLRSHCSAQSSTPSRGTTASRAPSCSASFATMWRACAPPRWLLSCS